MPKQKVIIIGPAFPFRGGIANFNNALSQEYYKRGDDVTLYSFTLQYPGFLFPGTTQYESGETPKGLKIKTLINSVNPFNWVKVARKINAEKPDLVIIRYWLPFMAPCLGSIARLLNKRIKIIAITEPKECSVRQTKISGCIPASNKVLTECCVGFVFSSPAAAR